MSFLISVGSKVTPQNKINEQKPVEGKTPILPIQLPLIVAQASNAPVEIGPNRSNIPAMEIQDCSSEYVETVLIDSLPKTFSRYLHHAISMQIRFSSHIGSPFNGSLYSYFNVVFNDRNCAAFDGKTNLQIRNLKNLQRLREIMNKQKAPFPEADIEAENGVGIGSGLKTKSSLGWKNAEQVEKDKELQTEYQRLLVELSEEIIEPMLGIRRSTNGKYLIKGLDDGFDSKVDFREHPDNLKEKKDAFNTAHFDNLFFKYMHMYKKVAGSLPPIVEAQFRNLYIGYKRKMALTLLNDMLHYFHFTDTINTISKNLGDQGNYAQYWGEKNLTDFPFKMSEEKLKLLIQQQSSVLLRTLTEEEKHKYQIHNVDDLIGRLLIGDNPFILDEKEQTELQALDFKTLESLLMIKKNRKNIDTQMSFFDKQSQVFRFEYLRRIYKHMRVVLEFKHSPEIFLSDIDNLVELFNKPIEEVLHLYTGNHRSFIEEVLKGKGFSPLDTGAIEIDRFYDFSSLLVNLSEEIIYSLLFEKRERIMGLIFAEESPEVTEKQKELKYRLIKELEIESLLLIAERLSRKPSYEQILFYKAIRPDIFSVVVEKGNKELKLSGQLYANNELIDFLNLLYLKSQRGEEVSEKVRIAITENKVTSANIADIANQARTENDFRFVFILHQLYVRTCKPKQTFENWLIDDNSAFQLVKNGILSIALEENILVGNIDFIAKAEPYRAGEEESEQSKNLYKSTVMHSKKRIITGPTVDLSSIIAIHGKLLEKLDAMIAEKLRKTQNEASYAAYNRRLSSQNNLQGSVSQPAYQSAYQPELV